LGRARGQPDRHRHARSHSRDRPSLRLLRRGHGGARTGRRRARRHVMSARRKVVICGAGFAGVAAAHALVTAYGADDVTIIDRDRPLSLTSDKSTEAYRNWWPGPDWEMTAFMDRSLDLIEAIARATANRINLNRRG